MLFRLEKKKMSRNNNYNRNYSTDGQDMVDLGAHTHDRNPLPINYDQDNDGGGDTGQYALQYDDQPFDDQEPFEQQQFEQPRLVQQQQPSRASNNYAPAVAERHQEQPKQYRNPYSRDG